jgi:hypothetical protein
VQAGILEDRRPDSGVRAAVLADPELAERQKQVLLEIYDSFRRETALNAGPPAIESGEAAPAGAAAPDPGSGASAPAATGTRSRRRTPGTGTPGTGTPGTGSTGAGPAPANGQAAGTAYGAGDRPGGTDEESSGAEAPARSEQGPAARQARKGEIRK